MLVQEQEGLETLRWEGKRKRVKPLILAAANHLRDCENTSSPGPSVLYQGKINILMFEVLGVIELNKQ